MSQAEDRTLMDGTAVGWPEPPGAGRSILVGSAVGVVVSLVGVAAGMVAIGVEGASAIGFGLFVALWGGLGFGSMVGGVLWASRIEREAHGAAPAAEARAASSTPGAADGFLRLAR